MCYAVATGTLTEYDGRRHSFVEKPTSGNSSAFAGVSAAEHNVPAGEMALLEIYVPGSRGVKVNVGASTVANVSKLVFDISSGVFELLSTASGRGAAYARQTVTYSSSNVRNLCQADLMEGAESGGQA